MEGGEPGNTSGADVQTRSSRLETECTVGGPGESSGRSPTADFDDTDTYHEGPEKPPIDNRSYREDAKVHKSRIHFVTHKARKNTHQPRAHGNTHSCGQSVLGDYKAVRAPSNSVHDDANTDAMQAEICARGGHTPVLDHRWWQAHTFLKERAQDDERRSTCHPVGKTQDRGEFRELTCLQQQHVSDLKLLSVIMGHHLQTCYSVGLIITIPSVPDEVIMNDGSKQVFVAVGSYPSVHEPSGQFLSVVLGTFLYTLLVGVLPGIHLAMLDLHYRMETRVYRFYTSDPETAEPFQLDIEDFHKTLSVSVQKSLGLYLDYTVARVLETRTEEQGGTTVQSKFSVWDRFGERVIKPLMTITMHTFVSSCERMNHPQGLYCFAGLHNDS